MELQLEIDKAVKQGQSISERAMHLIEEGNFPKDASDGVLWVSADNEPGFKGSVADYAIYVAEKNKENSPPQNRGSHNSFIDFKSRFRKSVPREHQTPQEKQFFQEMSVASLRDDLLSYIEMVEKEKDVSVRFSGFRKEEKINAAQALIDVLQGGGRCPRSPKTFTCLK